MFVAFVKHGTARTKFTARVATVVRRIPRGKVASYGQVAALAGAPRAARMVGYALRRLDGVPWWRVVAADGRIAVREPASMREQARRLAAEGVRVREGRVAMEEHRWTRRRAARA